MRGSTDSLPRDPKETAVDDHNTEASAIIEFAKEHVTPSLMQLSRGSADAAPVLLVPAGLDVKSIKPLLDEYLPQPERRRGTTVLTDPASFVEFVNRTKNRDSVIYADDGERPSLTAVIDHDERGEDGFATARWGQHRAMHAIELSPEWKAWRKADNTVLTQRDFAELVEDRALDLIDEASLDETHPVRELAKRLNLTLATASEVIEASRGLKLRAEVNVGETVTLSSGESELHYTETHKGANGETLRVPSAFLIAVKVLKGEGHPLDVLIARLRSRRVSGQPRVSWCVVLHAAEGVQRTALKELIERVRSETGLDLYRGAPAK